MLFVSFGVLLLFLTFALLGNSNDGKLGYLTTNEYVSSPQQIQFFNVDSNVDVKEEMPEVLNEALIKERSLWTVQGVIVVLIINVATNDG